MAKKKNQSSKAPRNNSKEKNIESNSLLPARAHGERLDREFPVRVKIENEMEIDFPSNNPDIADLFQGISDARNGTVLSEAADSNHSNTSTCTEPMDNGEENDSGSHTGNSTVSHLEPTSFAQLLVKQEIEMPEIPSNQAGCFSPLNVIDNLAAVQTNVKDLLSNHHVENSINNVSIPSINDLVKKEPIENNENSQDINAQSMIEAPESVTESDNSYNNDKLRKKRKPHLDAELEKLRKRLKKEPCEDDVNENETNFPCEQNNETQHEDTPVLPLSEINGISDQVRKDMPSDNESCDDAVKGEIIDNDISVLPTPKIEKEIELICLSDDEDPQKSEQDTEMIIDIENISSTLPSYCHIPVQSSAESLASQPLTSASPKKLTKERNFSTDILSNFNIVSELDRYDCQACLDSLQKKKINNPFNDFFPIVKSEVRSKDEIPKRDLLFKKVTIEVPTDTNRTAISQNVTNILQNLPVQSTIQSVSERFPAQLPSTFLPAKTCSTSISKNVNYGIPEKCQPTVNFLGLSTMISPNLLSNSTSSNFNLNQSPNSWSATSMTSNPELTPDKIKNILSSLSNFLLPDASKKGAASDQHHIVNSNQVNETTVISPQISSPQASLNNGASQKITPSLNHTFQMPYCSSTTSAVTGSSYSEPTTSYLPAAPCTSTASSFSRETRDSHHTVNKPIFLSSSKTEIQSRNTTILHPQASFQPVVTLPNNFQNLSSSINPSKPVASSLSLGTRDPRTAANRHFRTEFTPRKGKKNLSLYLNIGKDYITEHFEELILQWNPEWLRIQEITNTLPPISSIYKTVVYFYSNEMDYYNTYVPLHLLHVWLTIFQCWKDAPHPIVKCKVQSVERKDNGFTITVCAEMENSQVLPKNDDIVWCIHKKEEAFLRVDEVKRKPLGFRVKLKMMLHTLHNFHLNFDDEVSLAILGNTRAACLQTEALNSIDNTMKDLVLKPTEFLNKIKIVQLCNTKKIKEQRDDIIKVVVIPHVRVVVIETYYPHDSVLLLTQLTFNILKIVNSRFSEKYDSNSKNQTTTRKQSKVLIILKNDHLLEKLYKRLSQYKSILAVRTKQVNLSPEFIKYTIEDCLERKEPISKILQEHYIFLTTVSAFGSAEKTQLSKLKDCICIIDDAHLCTEVETALPLTLKISKLLLIGNKDRVLTLPNVLHEYKYDISLFVRLMKAQRRL